MVYARHVAKMREHVEGASTSAHLQKLAKQGDKVAAAALAAPGFPEQLDYLWSWANQLHGRSGVNMGGFNPLTYGTITDWARWTGNEPEPHDVRALFALDAVLLSDGKTEKAH